MPKLNLVSSLFVGLLLGCAGVVRAQTAKASGVDVYDGFETASLSKAWDTDRFKPGAVTMETNIVRAGHGAVKITVQANDKFEAGVNGNSDSERDELLEARKLTARENVNYEQSFSMYFPTDFPIVPTRLVIAQWKQYCANGGNCSDDSPVLAIRYISGELRITQDLDKKFIVLYREKNEFRGRWLDFKFQVRFSSKENGRIKAWLGDRQLVDYKGVTANPENAVTGYPSPSRFYFKMGLYRNVMPEPMTIYIDEYRKKQLPAGSF
jgi:Polysaccharide lyase